MAALNFYKTTTMPTTWQPDAVYLVLLNDRAEIYSTSRTGVAKMVGNTPMIKDIVDTAIAAASGSNANELQVVANIAARNALNPTRTTLVLVEDATGDASVKSGAATYVFKTGTSSWSKVSEFESLDLQLTWAMIDGRPTSTPTQIDAAVTATHSHTNKSTLDGLGDAGGKLTYNNTEVGRDPMWASTDW